MFWRRLPRGKNAKQDDEQEEEQEEEEQEEEEEGEEKEDLNEEKLPEPDKSEEKLGKASKPKSRKDEPPAKGHRKSVEKPSNDGKPVKSKHEEKLPANRRSRKSSEPEEVAKEQDEEKQPAKRRSRKSSVPQEEVAESGKEPPAKESGKSGPQKASRPKPVESKDEEEPPAKRRSRKSSEPQKCAEEPAVESVSPPPVSIAKSNDGEVDEKEEKKRRQSRKSSAYHTAKRAALAAGKSTEEAKDLAKEADAIFSLEKEVRFSRLAMWILIHTDSCGLFLAGPDCSSWGIPARGTSWRTRVNIHGNIFLAWVRGSSCMISRLVLCILLAMSRNIAWVVEQPHGSLLENHKRFSWMCNTVAWVWRSAFWMILHGAPSSKRTWCYSNMQEIIWAN
ncbi:unnamed protein product [Durusdinium trenchii]|uniref:Uncharacterized protein n=1 Tax=Durusdinium trenchii TaxID=1381693 RepID=A0ABP0SEZ5_9DINO